MRKFDIVKYTPTVHVLVDDSPHYLRSLSALLPPENNLYKYFTNPLIALDWVNSPENDHGEFDNSVIGRNSACSHIEIDFSHLHKVIYSDSRFKNISTIIIDYDMPGMNGLDFCKSIKNPHITKILLTGHLDDKDAREARNNGWVDIFLTKGEDNAQKLAEVIFGAEAKYNEESNRLFKVMLQKHEGSQYCKSDKVKGFIKSVYDKHNAVEYYALNLDGDYIFVDGQGKTCGVSIQDKTRRNGYLEMARDTEGHSEELLCALNSSNIFCYNDDTQFPPASSWKKYIHRAEVIDQDREIMAACGVNIFTEKANNIKPFKPIYDQHINEAMNALRV